MVDIKNQKLVEKDNELNELEIKLKNFDLANAALKAVQIDNAYVQEFKNLIERNIWKRF
jgi:hypothetical protein